MTDRNSICVYCGSQNGKDALYLEAADTLGRAMASSGIDLVYGGGMKGIMGATARGVLEGGGRVTGIIPRFLIEKEAGTETALASLSEVIVTENMHERKHAMFERADAFVTLPGGIGTLEELVEILTWAQLGRHEKPICLANIGGFWNPLIDLLDHMQRARFIHTASRVKPLIVEQADAIVPAITAAWAALQSDDGQAGPDEDADTISRL